MQYKLGRKPTRYVKEDLRFGDYKTTSTITLPNTFGYAEEFSAYGFLGNDLWGDCVWAGSDHETMIINKLAGGNATFTEANALSDYSAVTGFNINAGPSGSNSTDNGTDVHDALAYRVKTGVVDASGNRHKLAGYVALEPGNLQHVLEAVYLFDAVGLGINFPESADDQFSQGQPWTVVAGAQIEGGHYIPIEGRPSSEYLAIITWGKRQLMSNQFFSTYCEELYAIISEESIAKKTQESSLGYNWAQLQEDFSSLYGGSAS